MDVCHRGVVLTCFLDQPIVIKILQCATIGSTLVANVEQRQETRETFVKTTHRIADKKRGKKLLTVIPLSLRVEEIIEQRDDCFAR